MRESFPDSKFFKLTPIFTSLGHFVNCEMRKDEMRNYIAKIMQNVDKKRKKADFFTEYFLFYFNRRY